MKTIKWCAVILWVVSVPVSIACLPNSSPALGARFGEAANSTYQAKCAICHGADGSGNTANGKKLNVRDLRSAEVQKLSDAQLIEVIGKGKNKMPGYQNMVGADQVKQLAAYTRELAKKR